MHNSSDRPPVQLPSKYGLFTISILEDIQSTVEKEHCLLTMGTPKDDCLVRIHSECLTGDLFGSIRCDCGTQLEMSLQKIAEEGEGIVIYLRQEGRGIGLSNKLKAYNLQDRGLDTVEANLELGYEADERNYRVAVEALQKLSIHSVRLLSNNPLKVQALEHAGIRVSERISLVPKNIPPLLRRYLSTKAEKMGHLIELPDESK